MSTTQFAPQSACRSGKEPVRQRSELRWLALLLSAICFAVLGGGLSAGPAAAEEPRTPEQRLGQELSSGRAESLADSIDLAHKSKSGAKVDTRSAQAWNLEDGSIYVKYSFEGDIESVSNIGAVISSDGTVIATAEIVLSAISEDSGKVQVWTNGEKTAEETVTSYDASQGVTVQSDGFWGKLNDCLSSQGIASWIVAGLSVACAAACVGTAGAGCVACIAAAAGVTGGTAGYCVDQAFK